MIEDDNDDIDPAEQLFDPIFTEGCPILSYNECASTLKSTKNGNQVSHFHLKAFLERNKEFNNENVLHLREDRINQELFGLFSCKWGKVLVIMCKMLYVVS